MLTLALTNLESIKQYEGVGLFAYRTLRPLDRSVKLSHIQPGDCGESKRTDH